MKMSDLTTKEIPEVAGETQQDPDIVGTLNPEEMAQLMMLRQKGSQITLEIGSLEIRKARLLGSLMENEEYGQRLLNTAAQRLGIAEGQPWQVLPDGRARILRNAPNQ
jgi:hypothetical protein